MKRLAIAVARCKASTCKHVLALALGAATALPISPRTVVAQNQITSCVEVPLSIVDASRRRAATSSDCNPQRAREKARDEGRRKSHVRARDALDNICVAQISAADAEATCIEANGAVPTSVGTSLSGNPVVRSGASRVDSQLPIGSSNPKLCVVLRDLPGETDESTAFNGWCAFDNSRETFVKVRSRARCGVACFDIHQHQLEVRRFTTAALPNAQASAILADATEVLKTDDGAGDINCAIKFSRVGSVTTFAMGDGSIDTPGEFANVIGLAGNVKVVNAITRCGPTPAPIGLSFAGCTIRGGNSIIVVRTTAAQEGQLWAHELGHSRGLPDLDNVLNNVNRVMNGVLSATTRRVTSNECSAYRSSLISATAFAAAATTPQAATAAELPDARVSDITQFVRLTFVHGVPYKGATQFTSEVVPTLLKMLDSAAEEPHWPNIIVVLGMIGDESAIDKLIAFIERSRGKISSAHYRAKTAAIMSLGYLINKTGSRKALDYLTRGLNPKVWATKAGAGLAPYQSSTVERNHDFAKYAILGLALSGHLEAADALRAFPQLSETTVEEKYRVKMRDVAAEALKDHEKVANRGLAEYYRSQ